MVRETEGQVKDDVRAKGQTGRPVPAAFGLDALHPLKGTAPFFGLCKTIRGQCATSHCGLIGQNLQWL
jgi:hypothetical protein